MKWLNRLERSVGGFAVPHVTLFLVFLQSLAFVFSKAAEARNPEHASAYLDKLALEGDLVLHGEPWRVLTFVVIPPLTNPIFFFFAMYLLYLMGTALESHWGTFRYNIFLLVGWAATVAVALLLPKGEASNAYLMESIFLAFAFLYPDFELRLFFFFPVKVKWLALLAWIAYLLQFCTGNWLEKCLVLAAIANFLLFFHGELWQRVRGGHRRMRARARNAPPMDDVFNRCTTCGVTEKSNPKAEFRYCPQCTGTLCYCIDHINSHEHRRSGKSPAPMASA